MDKNHQDEFKKEIERYKRKMMQIYGQRKSDSEDRKVEAKPEKSEVINTIKTEETISPKNKDSKPTISEEIESAKPEVVETAESKETISPKNENSKPTISEATETVKPEVVETAESKETISPKNEDSEPTISEEIETVKPEVVETSESKETVSPKNENSKSTITDEIETVKLEVVETAESEETVSPDNEESKPTVSEEINNAQPKGTTSPKQVGLKPAVSKKSKVSKPSNANTKSVVSDSVEKNANEAELNQVVRKVISNSVITTANTYNNDSTGVDAKNISAEYKDAISDNIRIDPNKIAKSREAVSDDNEVAQTQSAEIKDAMTDEIDPNKLAEYRETISIDDDSEATQTQSSEVKDTMTDEIDPNKLAEYRETISDNDDNETVQTQTAEIIDAISYNTDDNVSGLSKLAGYVDAEIKNTEGGSGSEAVLEQAEEKTASEQANEELSSVGTQPVTEQQSESVISENIISTGDKPKVSKPNDLDKKQKVGYLQVVALTNNRRLSGVRCRVSKEIKGERQEFFNVVTGKNGATEKLPLPILDGMARSNRNRKSNFTLYDLEVSKKGYLPMKYINIPIFEGILSTQKVKLTVDTGLRRSNPPIIVDVGTTK